MLPPVHPFCATQTHSEWIPALLESVKRVTFGPCPWSHW